MSAPLDSVSKNASLRASVRSLAIPELLVFLTFTGVALASATSWMEGAAFAAPSLGGILGLAGIIALPTLVAVVVLSLRRAHVSRRRTRKALASIEARQVTTPPAILAHSAQREVEVRALRLTVRTLTAELAEQRSQVVEQAQARLEEQAYAQAQSRDVGRERKEMRAAESRRVLLMIRAMREATAGEPGAEHVLNRIEAALTRLNAPSGGRPTLPSPVTRDTVPEGVGLHEVVPPVMTAATSMSPEPAPAPNVPAPTAPSMLSEPSANRPAPDGPMPPATESPINGSKVLPVPPPASEPPAVRAGGRWFRRSSGRPAERSSGQQVPR